jgi:NhaP-type Na+/H+ or K+/H+ antiporter
VSISHWALPAIAVMLIAYGAVSGRLRSTPVSQSMVFVTLGLLAGSQVVDLVDAGTVTQFVRHLAEATLTLVLFTDAVRVNRGRLQHESALPTRLLGVGLPLTIVAGTLAGLVLLPQLNLWTAAALATMLAPTDAALGLPVVTNQRLPSRIRQGLNVESGLNDGVCVPLLLIFLTIAQAEEGIDYIEPVRVVTEQTGELLNAVTFLLFGAVLLGPALGELDWPIALYAVASLTVVRMLPVALAMVGAGMRRVTVGFLGWFGPRGLASIVFVLVLLEETDLPERSLMLTVVTWTVALSVYAHGLTAGPGATRYANWYHAHHEHHRVMPESASVAEQRTRGPAFSQRSS